MKKITKILSLTVVVASMMTPLALLANNSNGVNVKQEVNEVGSDASVELDNIDDDVEADSQAIDVNSAADNDEAIGDTITSNDCTAEDSGQTTTTWMGIISDFVNFTISKNYVSELEFGEATMKANSVGAFRATDLRIPNYIVYSNNGIDRKYNIVKIESSAFTACYGLTGTFTIPTSVTSIGDFAFSSCFSLTSLGLSNATNLTTIGINAFNGCTGLTGNLTIPASVTSIGDSAFSGIGSQEFNFISETPPTLGTNIFGTNVTKTLWVPSARAKALYDPFAVFNFGLTDSSYIKVAENVPTSVDITNLNGPYTINLNDTNKSIATAKADVKPIEATNKDVTWSLENAPIWLKIDANGNIFANEDLKNVTPGKFTFKVKVVCQANAVSNTTGDIELNVIQQENNDSFAWWWLLVAEAGALLLIGIISISVIVVKNKKNK